MVPILHQHQDRYFVHAVGNLRTWSLCEINVRYRWALLGTIFVIATMSLVAWWPHERPEPLRPGVTRQNIRRVNTWLTTDDVIVLFGRPPDSVEASDFWRWDEPRLKVQISFNDKGLVETCLVANLDAKNPLLSYLDIGTGWFPRTRPWLPY